MKQKLALITALMHRPKLLILDEPTTALDPLVRQALFDELRTAASAGRTVVFSSHTLSEVQELCTHVAITRAGGLVEQDQVDALRRRALRHVEIVFTGQIAALPPPEALRVEQRGDGRLSGTWVGPVAPLLQWLAHAPVRDVMIAPPRLDDPFMAYYADALPLYRQRAAVPPQRHPPHAAALGDFLAHVDVRPLQAEAHVAELQAANLADPQAAAGGQPEDDEVLPAIDRTPRAALQVGQHAGDLGLAEDLGRIDFPGGGHRQSLLPQHCMCVESSAMRSLWGYGALFIASLGAIDLLLAPTVGTVVGLLLLAFMGYALAWFHPRLAGSRFPIRVGVVVSVIGVATWLVSLLARIEVTTGPNQAWVLGYGQVEQTTYRGQSARFAAAPGVSVRWEPLIVPIGCTSIGLGHARAFTSRILSWPTAIPTVLLLQRHRRIPVGHCRRCGYNLTGNVSGVCPECGTPIASTAK